MNIYPENAIEKIEFNKIREWASSYAISSLAKARIESELPSSKQNVVRENLEHIAELLQLYPHRLDHPILNYKDIEDACHRLEIVNMVLDVREVLDILTNILTVQSVVNFFQKEDYLSLFPKHRELVKQFYLHSEVMREIKKIIDQDGNVKDEASAKLKLIRSEIRRKNAELEKAFRQVLKKYKKEGMLSDHPESIKFGRRVLSLPVENKRKIEGMIHAESSSGRTVFIEPREVSLLNNQLTDLGIEERNEIYRILKELSGKLAPHREEFLSNLHGLVEMDIYQAKAKLGHEMEACLPKLTGSSQFNLKEAYHPFLLLKNKALNRATIPFNLFLNEESRVLLLSGPNAGGKTISMKAAGLIVCMIQTSYLVPVDPQSELGWFRRIFVELGDQQSIENELSTYSSRLVSMKHVLENANNRSLVLIDEFGSGTDPKIGGAIAEAMLERLLHLKSLAVITTHYDNLKRFAFRNKGIVNGSMLFDMQSMSPSYQLKMGKPGSSFGLEIAQRIGLPQKIVSRAKKLVGSNQIKMEDMLNSIEKENLATINEKEKLESKSMQLDRLIKQYDQMFADFELKRKRLKLEIKQLEAQKLTAQKMAVDQLLKELKEENKKKEELVKLSVKYKKELNDNRDKLEQVNREFDTELEKTNERSDLEIGDFVKLKTADTRGRIIEFVKEGVALVEAGILKLNVNVGDLIRVNEPLSVQSKKSVDYRSNAISFNPKIDIRGYKLKDAEAIIEEFYDKALLSNYRQLTVLHGIGSGILKKMVWKKAKEYKFSGCNHPEEEYGGERLTNISI